MSHPISSYDPTDRASDESKKEHAKRKSKALMGAKDRVQKSYPHKFTGEGKMTQKEAETQAHRIYMSTSREARRKQK